MEKRRSKLRSVLTFGGVLLAVVCFGVALVASAQGRPAVHLSREPQDAKAGTAGMDRSIALVTFAADEAPEPAFPESGMSQRGQALVAPMEILQSDPTLKLAKTVVNDNGGGAAAGDWTLSADADNPNQQRNFDDSGDSVTFHEVFAGVGYTLSESTVAGYAAGTWSCGGGSLVGSTVTLGLDENVTCYITNDDEEPSLTLVKAVTNDNGGTSTESAWTLMATGPAGFSGPGPSVSNGADFQAGTYDLSETGPAGYGASAWVCTGTGTQDDGDTVTLGPGETMECTITNDDQEPSLTLVKAVTNDNGGTSTESAWTLTATGPTGFSGPGPTVSSGVGFDVGTYDLSETGPAGYDASAWVCTGTGTQDDGDTVTLGFGETLECTITNDDQEPSLTLVKAVTNDNGGTSTESAWTLTATGSTGFSGPGPSVSNGASFDAGTYDLSETGPAGYDASAWVCTGTGTQDDGDTVTLGLGETLECTITNDDQEPSLTLVKVVTNDSGGTATGADWTLTATGPTGFSGPGPTVSSGVGFDVGTYDLSETGPAGYDASAWVCTGTGTQDDGDTVTLGLGETMECTITNDDVERYVSFTSDLQSNPENVGTMSIVAELDLVAGLDVTIPLLISGTATPGAGQDFTIAPNPAVISAGNDTVTIVITVNNDSLDEFDETVIVTMGEPTNALLGAITVHTATIEDNDPEPLVSFGSSAQILSEKDGLVQIDVDLSDVSGRDVGVPFALTGTATEGADYVVFQNPVTITAGTDSTQILMLLDDDALDEDSEQIVVTMGTPVNATKGAPSVHTATIIDDDGVPAIDFSDAAYSVEEADSIATITVRLDVPSGRTVTVNYATSNGTAIAGSDYTAVADILTFTAGQTERTFTVPVIQDLRDEEDEEYLTLSLSGPVNAAFPPPASRNTPARLTILDSDPLPTVDFSAVSYSNEEGTVAVPIGVTLSPPSGRTVTVEYASSAGTATPGSDYTEINGTVTFDPSEFWQTFALPIAEDTLDEIPETIVLTLSNPGNANLDGNNPATFTILDDDEPPVVDFAEVAYSIEEDVTSAVITVTLSSASGQVVTVNYATSAGSATEGADYSDEAGQITFLPGDVSESFMVPILEDLLDEDDETVTLTLSGADNAGLGDVNNPAILTITDDDAEPTLAFSLPQYDVVEQGTSVLVTVMLSAPSGRTVSVDYASSEGTATAGTDYTDVDAALTFDPSVVVRTFTVPILEDLRDEDDETVFLTLSAPLYAGIAGTNPVTLTISDDDPLPLVDFDSSSYGVGEGDVPVLVTVTLDAESGRTVTVDYASSDGTAKAGSDYATTVGTLEFLPGETSDTFEVPVLGDAVDEDDETLQVTLSGESNAEFPLTPNNPATLTIYDNDLAGIVVSPTVLTVSEPGTSDFFTITLTSSPTAPVTISVETSDDTECEVLPELVPLTEGNWNSGFKVEVRAKDDPQQDGAQECMVTGNATSTDGRYAGLPVDDVTVTVLDNDVVFQFYLPVLMRDWPPAPEIDPILGAENGSYAVTWDAVVGATSYVLQEATRSDFGDAVVVLDGTSRFYSVTGAGAGRRYYRARARGPWGEGRWSDKAWADVLWEAEPNDVGGPGGQANGPIVPGLTYFGKMTSGADVKDYFYFDVTGPQNVKIELTNIPAGQNYDLALRSGAQWPAAIDWTDPGDPVKDVAAVGLATGTYYIQIYNTGGGGSTQEYHLRMTFP